MGHIPEYRLHTRHSGLGCFRMSRLYRNSLNPFLFTKGLSCPLNVQTSLTQNCLKLTIPGFPYTLLYVSCRVIGFLKTSQVYYWPRNHFGPSCPLQTILLSDLIGCDRPLQMVMTIWRIFLNLKRAKQPLLPAEGCHTPPRKFRLKKTVPNCHYTGSAEGCQTRLDGQHCPLRT